MDAEAPPLPARHPPNRLAASGLRIGRHQTAIATVRSVGLLFSRTVAVGVFMVNIQEKYQFDEHIDPFPPEGGREGGGGGGNVHRNGRMEMDGWN